MLSGNEVIDSRVYLDGENLNQIIFLSHGRQWFDCWNNFIFIFELWSFFIIHSDIRIQKKAENLRNNLIKMYKFFQQNQQGGRCI